MVYCVQLHEVSAHKFDLKERVVNDWLDKNANPTLFFRAVDVVTQYRTTCGTSYLKPHSTASCNVTVTHDESAVCLVEA